MDADLRIRILEMLCEAPAGALPLREVHRALAEQLGARAGTLTQLRERLNAEPGGLLVVEPEHPLGDRGDWPSGVLAEYDDALRAAGLDTEPWLAAVSPGSEPPDPVDASLRDLWESGTLAPALRTAVAAAIAERRSLRERAGGGISG